MLIQDRINLKIFVGLEGDGTPTMIGAVYEWKGECQNALTA